MKYVLLFILIAAIFIPRLIELNTQFNYFESEQANEFLITKAIVVDKVFPIIGSYALNESSGVYRSPFWNYLLIIPFVLGNGNPYFLKLLMLTLAIVLLTITFFVIKKTMGKNVAVMAILLLSFSPILTELSVRVWPPNVVPFLVPLLLFFLYKIYKKQSVYVIPFTLTFAAIAHLEYAVGIRHILILIPLAIILVKKKALLFKQLILSLILFLSTFTTLFLYYANKDILKIVSTAHESASNNNLLQSLLQTSISLFWGFQSTFTANVFLSLAIIGFMTTTITWGLRKGVFNSLEKSFIMYFLALLGSLYFIALFYRQYLPGWWIYDLSVFYCVILSLCLSKFLKHQIRKVLVFVFLFILIGNQIGNMHTKLTTQQINPHPLKSIYQLAPIDYLYSVENKPFNIEIASLSSNVNDYKYLFWWWGERNSEQQPKFSKNGEHYLIIDRRIEQSRLEKQLQIPANETLLERIKISEEFYIDKRRKTN